MKLTFLETPVFTQQITRLLRDDEYRQMQEHLMLRRTAGEVIVGTAGCRKLRWRVSRRKGGKSGGIRVIYYLRNAEDQILFLLAYDRRIVDDLTPVQRRQLARIVRQLK